MIIRTEKLKSGNLLSAIGLAIVVTLTMASPARADFTSLSANWNDALQFAVLAQFSTAQLNYNNGTIIGDVGLGSPRQFTISNASITGNIRFSGASNTTGLTPNPDPGSKTGPFTVSGGGTVSGNVVAGDTVVTDALNAANSLSQTAGGEASTALTLTSSQIVNASSGVLDAGGNRVFSAASVNLSNATTLTINGSASDYVIINVTDNNPNFNGTVVLTGGITSDHVLFNMFGGNYVTHTGGATLTVSTNGAITTGIFLDPNGGMQMNNSTLNGRFFGGDTTNMQIVSGDSITAPVVGTPEPASLLLLGFGLAGAAYWKRRRSNQ